MNKRLKASRLNARLALSIWGDISQGALLNLKELTRRYALSVAAGDLQFLDGRWYVTHAGLLLIAQRRRCSGIRTALQKELTDPAANRWIFKATVYKTTGSRGFVGYGDADPSNVSPLVRGAEMRVAETRAVNRAFARPTESGYVLSRSWAGLPALPVPPGTRTTPLSRLIRTGLAMGNPGCATACVS